MQTPRRNSATSRAPAKKQTKKKSTQSKHGTKEASDEDGRRRRRRRRRVVRDGSASTGEKHKAGNKRKAPSNTARRGGKKGRCIDESEEATSAVDSPRAQHTSTRGTRKHVRLTPDEHASASVAKYLDIVSIAKMQKKDKIELLEVVLLTETDLDLKAMIEDCLTEDMDLEELSRILEEAECICSDDA